MNTQNRAKFEKASRRQVAVLALSLILAAGGTAQACLAQGMDAQALGADQDSLLPPEVVPLDPAVAASMSRNQAQSRAAQIAMPDSSAVPGMSGSAQAQAQMNGMMTAQDYRKAALNSLMNQSQLAAGKGGQMGFPGQASGSFGNFNNPATASAALGQSPLIPINSGSDAQLGQSALIPPSQASSILQNGVASNPQSQTLTGGVRTQVVRHDIRRSGFSNALSAIGGFGSGLFLGSMVRNPNSAFGLGLMGLTMTGFGSRGMFRF